MKNVPKKKKISKRRDRERERERERTTGHDLYGMSDMSKLLDISYND